MEAVLSVSASVVPYRFRQFSLFSSKPTNGIDCLLILGPANRKSNFISSGRSRSRRFTLCVLMEEKNKEKMIGEIVEEGREKGEGNEFVKPIIPVRVEEKLARKKQNEKTYLVAAVMSSLGVTSMAIAAVYYRFYGKWRYTISSSISSSLSPLGGEIPVAEMLGTFALSVGAAVGMEFWARWAHKELWHASLWNMHESHHQPREGPFELNDIFAIINAVPAITLLSYGFFHKGLLPGLCFGAGLGITVFGIAYMFVHDGLVHRRFPVGPIADVPYFRRVAAAHQIHHSEKFNGVPYGLFLGPKELEEVGGIEELEKKLAEE